MTAAVFESTLKVNTDPSIYTLGTRCAAVPLREQLESALQTTDGDICLDFSGVMVTHGFMDSLLGALILRYGPALLKRIAFKACSEDVQAVLQFVVNTRARGYKELAGRVAVS